MAAQKEPTLLMSRWYRAKSRQELYGNPQGAVFAVRKWGKHGMVVLMDDRARVFTGQCFANLFELQRKGSAWDEMPREENNDRYTDHVARRTIDMRPRIDVEVFL